MNITIKNLLLSLLLVIAPLQSGIARCEEVSHCVQETSVHAVDAELKEIIEILLFDNGPDPRSYTAEERERIKAFLDSCFACPEIKGLKNVFYKKHGACQELKSLQEHMASLLLEDLEDFLEEGNALLTELRKAKNLVDTLDGEFKRELNHFCISYV